ncbi:MULTISPECIES: hypothetical protein [unclassified Staphylococcus]|uniref:hypothetical protein n=1 Tax=unclassified Staphylococcus TaxID=91994 RepID=UPI0021D382C0|nr:MULTISPECIES: hypothetical protein [unclassified Staphylococcus]UXR78778.1 hypothetical protein MUA92_02480 [Staphylococcus sp. IVB6227]UXR82938.1 hypothetical protein MUA51_02450 [Staphylococcus sp. IVB6214]
MNQKQQPEVIDPNDPRYKRPEHFDQSKDTYHTTTGGYQIYTRSFGCTPVGCLPGCLLSIILSIVLTLLLNLLF